MVPQGARSVWKARLRVYSVWSYNVTMQARRTNSPARPASVGWVESGRSSGSAGTACGKLASAQTRQGGDGSGSPRGARTCDSTAHASAAYNSHPQLVRLVHTRHDPSRARTRVHPSCRASQRYSHQLQPPEPCWPACVSRWISYLLDLSQVRPSCSKSLFAGAYGNTAGLED